MALKFSRLHARCARLAGVAALLAVVPQLAAFADSRPAPAGASFDGKWAIEASTRNFFCPVKSKQLTALVVGGKVVGLWGLPGNPTASGTVTDDGAVTIQVRIASLDVTATIHGKVAGKAGQGAWSANSILCSNGIWRAAAN